MSISFSVVELKTENKENPNCIDERIPQFSWKFANTQDAFFQTAYHILVATTPDLLTPGAADLWDSGKVSDASPVYHNYKGRPLESRQQCYWKVKAWDNQHNESEWSQTSAFRMGLLDIKDWQSKWIGYDQFDLPVFDKNKRYFVADDFDLGTNDLHLPPVRYFRKDFSVDKPVKKATVYISALGLYELQINGEKIGIEYFTPGWSDFSKRVYYEAYDIPLKTGDNAIGIMLADGWYSGYVGLVSRQTWGDFPRVTAQLEITYEDGMTEVIATGAEWQAAFGAIREADILHGETYDATKEIADWSKPGCAFDGWDKAEVAERPKISVDAHIGPYNRVIKSIKPEHIGQSDDGGYIFDTKLNITGFASLMNINEDKGTKIKIEYAEILNNGGDIDKRVYRSARATDFYICNGSGNESFEPRFTFRSFRYIKINGLSAMPKTEDIAGIFVSSDLKEIGQFSCSDPVMNDIYAMLKQTIKCGYMEVPMDCCERDERLGWGQDGNHSLRLGAYLYDLSDFISKWQTDIMDGQKEDGAVGPTSPFVYMGDIGQFSGDIMSDCGLHAPWVMYKMYGNTRILEKHYDAMKRYFQFVQNNSDRNMRNSITGDWLQVLENGFTDYIHGWGDTARDLIGTAFLVYDAYIMKKTADVLGYETDAAIFQKQFEASTKAFCNTFEMRGNHFRDKTQTGYALALYFDLVSEKMKPYVAKYLADDVVKKAYSSTGGCIGAPYIYDVLSENGYHDVAVKTMMSQDYPGYGYMLKMDGTTCWERWDSLHHEIGVHPHNMNSYNHIGLSAGGAWFFKKLGGLTMRFPDSAK